jgi:hypothetical protein
MEPFTFICCIGCCVGTPIFLLLAPIFRSFEFYERKLHYKKEFQIGILLLLLALYLSASLLVDGPLSPPTFWGKRSVSVYPYGWTGKNGLKVYVADTIICNYSDEICSGDAHIPQGTLHDYTLWLDENRLEHHSKKRKLLVEFALETDFDYNFDEYSPDGKYHIKRNNIKNKVVVLDGNDEHYLRELDDRYFYQSPILKLRFRETIFASSILGIIGVVLITLAVRQAPYPPKPFITDILSE